MDEDVKAMLGQILTVVEGTRAEVRELQTEMKEVRAEARATRDEQRQWLGRLEAKVDQGDARGAQTQRDLEQSRHVASANHFMVIGRIDQVASMLADHMADTPPLTPIPGGGWDNINLPC